MFLNSAFLFGFICEFLIQFPFCCLSAHSLKSVFCYFVSFIIGLLICWKKWIYLVMIVFTGCYTLSLLHEDWDMQIWSNMQVWPSTSWRGNGHISIAGDFVFCTWWGEREWGFLNYQWEAAVEFNRLQQLMWTLFF